MGWCWCCWSCGRWRHLIIWWVVVQLGSLVTVGLAMVRGGARPFWGGALQSSWGGWAMPSVPIAYPTALVMGVLYTLVPQGRWRNTGKWVAAGLIGVVALARMALGVDAPDRCAGRGGPGVALPLLAFRRFTPNEAFPVAYRRGRSAHLDISGLRGEAIRRALKDQLGVVVLEVEPFGERYSASCTPLRIKVQGDPQATYLFAKLYARSHLRADRWYKLGRSCCMAGWRTRSRSTASGGWWSRRTTRCGCSATPGCPCQAARQRRAQP